MGLGPARVQKREHLGVHDPAASGQPLQVTLPVPSGGAERIGVVDIATADNGHGLEPAMWVLGKARHHVAVIHARPVEVGEVDADVTPAQ